MILIWEGKKKCAYALVILVLVSEEGVVAELKTDVAEMSTEAARSYRACKV